MRQTLILVVLSIPALLGLVLVIGAMISLLAARPDESRLRRAIDRNLVRGNLPANPRLQLLVGLAFIAVTALLILALLVTAGWDGSLQGWL